LLRAGPPTGRQYSQSGSAWQPEQPEERPRASHRFAIVAGNAEGEEKEAEGRWEGARRDSPMAARETTSTSSANHATPRIAFLAFCTPKTMKIRYYWIDSING